MAITLTESLLRQIIREEVSSFTRRPHRMTEGLRIKNMTLYHPSGRSFNGRRAVITGNSTPVEMLAVELQGWFNPDDFSRMKSLGLEAVVKKIMNISEFGYQAKRRGLEATPEIAAEVAKILIDIHSS